MPLPRATYRALEVKGLSGLDLERGKLVRPANSFQELTNFDLTIEKSIKKVGGIRRLTTVGGSGTAYVGLIDYRRTPTDEQLLLGLTAGGVLVNVLGDYSIATLGYTHTSIPFLTLLPWVLEGEKVQVILRTLGAQARPQIVYTTGLAAETFLLGAPSPPVEWDEDLYKHSLMAWARTTLDAADKDNGIAIREGRRYRWTYWDPRTRRESSPSAVHAEVVSVPFGDASLPISIPGMVRSEERWIPEIELHFNGSPYTFLLDQGFEDAYAEGFTHVRIWATPDSGSDFTFALLGTLYDEEGENVLDEDGAMPIQYVKSHNNFNHGDYTRFFDGWLPVGSSDWTVDSAHLAGVATLNITGGTISPGSAVEAPSFRQSDGKFVLHPDLFVIEGFETVYSVREVAGNALAITPDLVDALAGGEKILFVRRLPVEDTQLVTFPEQVLGNRKNDPPPPAVWGAVYGDRLWLVPAADRSRLVFSEVGEYGHFDPEDYITFHSDSDDEITALIASRQVGLITEGPESRLVVAKQRNTSQIRGIGLNELTRSNLHATTGIVGRRCVASVGEVLIALTQQGLEILNDRQNIFIGRKIRSLTEQIQHSIEYGPMMMARTQTGVFLLGYSTTTAASMSRLLMIDSVLAVQEDASPFSVIGPFVDADGGVLSFQVVYESIVGGAPRILLAGMDGYVYEIFYGGNQSDRNDGGADTPLIATAITQELPQEDKTSRKLFRVLRLEGNTLRYGATQALAHDATYNSIIGGWFVAYSFDGGITYTEGLPLRELNYIGRTGKTIVVKFTHTMEIDPAVDPAPVLSNFILEYATIGEVGYVSNTVL